MTRPPSRPLGALLAVVLLVTAAACDPKPGPPQAPATFAAVPPIATGSASVRIELDHVACGSATFCVAVPSSLHGTGGQPQRWAEAWDGTRWAPIPHPGIAVRAIDCAGSWCLALWEGDRGLGETGAVAWDGRSWTPVATPSLFAPHDLHCWSRDACVAAGRLSGEGGALRWDGARWTPLPGTRTASGVLVEVDCPSPGDCWFLAAPQSGNRTVERWTGGPWQTVEGTGRPLRDLSCAARRDVCVVTGSLTDPSSHRVELMALRGGSPPQVVPTGDGNVLGVDCGPEACVALTAANTVVYDGTAPPATAPAADPELRSRVPVTCVSTAFCVYLPARSSTRYRDPRRPPVFPTWDGRAWTTATAAPNPTEPRSALASVACTAPDACLAVGRTLDGTRQLGMAQRWDGRRWALAPAPPTPSGRHLDLRTISCSARNHCVAVGATTAVEDNPPPLEHLQGTRYVARFDGRAWTDESASLPAAASPSDVLTDVDCAGTACIAVSPAGGPPAPGEPFITGTAYRSTGPGRGWSTVPGPPAGLNFLPGGLPGRLGLQIECATATSCATTSLTAYIIATSYTSYWDGARWSYPPALTQADQVLAGGIACPVARRCLAPGASTVPVPSPAGAVLTWDGTRWVPERLPGVPGLGPTSCATAERCLSIPATVGGPVDLRFSAVRDATGWRPVPAPATDIGPLDRGRLDDVSCTPAMCLVVGFDDGTPLAYRWAF